MEKNKELYRLVLSRSIDNQLVWDAELNCDESDEVLNVIEALGDQIKLCIHTLVSEKTSDPLQ